MPILALLPVSFNYEKPRLNAYVRVNKNAHLFLFWVLSDFLSCFDPRPVMGFVFWLLGQQNNLQPLMVMQRIFFSQCKILRWEQNRPKKWKNKPMSLDGRSVCCLSLILWFWIWKQNCTYANLQVQPVILHQIYSNLRRSKNPNVCPSIQKKWQCSSQLACVSFKWKYWPQFPSENNLKVNSALMTGSPPPFM